MIKGSRYVGYYIDNYDSILPSDEALGDISTSLWYVFIKPLFNDYVWNNFYSRELFDNPRFTRDDPEDTLANIVKTILIHFKSKNRIYDRMFDAYMKDFNPLWNVDGVVGEIRETNHTGTDTDVKTGSDSVNGSDGGSLVRTGGETDTYNGTEANTRTGNEVDALSGSDTNTDSKTTFESNTLRNTDQSQLQYGKSETTTYNNVKDERSFNNRSDVHTYNSVTDTRNLTSNETTTYNSQNAKTLNLKDTDLFMQIRQGNIGVTRSDELIMRALEAFSSELYDFVHYVVNDTLNQISYCIY